MTSSDCSVFFQSASYICCILEEEENVLEEEEVEEHNIVFIQVDKRANDCGLYHLIKKSLTTNMW